MAIPFADILQDGDLPVRSVGVHIIFCTLILRSGAYTHCKGYKGQQEIAFFSW
jgi:hypothetical protein